MKLIEVNSYVPQIETAPHKIYVIEFSLEELFNFRAASREILKTLEPFTDIDDKTNIHVVGLDGDKGKRSHEKVRVTHGFIMDFRPLAIHIVYWEKPTPESQLKSVVIPKEVTKVTRKPNGAGESVGA